MSSLLQPTLFDLHDNKQFPLSPAVTAAIENIASNSSAETRGAIFTRTEVVEFILDLTGYTEEKELHHQRILEPSFGGGDFLQPIILRLISSWKKHRGNSATLIEDLSNSIRATELHKETFYATQDAIRALLLQEGLTPAQAIALTKSWLNRGDFLLESFDDQFNYIVGNPPYVRQELIPQPLLTEYRQRYQTMYDRADLYIPFIERSLSLLNKNGTLGYICADRWMKNRYGGPLRSLIARDFHLKTYVDMTDVDAFHSEVSSYPAITVIAKEKANATRVAHRPRVNRKTLQSLAANLLAESPTGDAVRELHNVADRDEPWLLDAPDQMTLIRRLERCFPTLEEVGCKVGIGVATGADKAFIDNFETLDVEPDRKLPLATTRDIRSGAVDWQGAGVINPFAENGKLVDLNEYPKLANYLKKHRDVIAHRHCAKKSPHNWYRTIDRIWPELTSTPKLLIPDIKGEAHIVFEPGNLYPHHNLYYIISNNWNLRALQAVLLSAISRLFVATYSTKMRGGYLRFQAQYLRRIRIPQWGDVSEELKCDLISAAESGDLSACNDAVFKLYNLSKEERTALGGNGG